MWELHDSFKMKGPNAFPTNNLKAQIKSRVFDFINGPNLIGIR